MSRTNKRNSQQARKLREFLIKKYGPVCQICVGWGRTGSVTLIDLTIDGGPLSYSVDHIVAVADGGTNLKDNLQPTHVLCNNIKGSKLDNRLRSMPRMPRANTARRLAS